MKTLMIVLLTFGAINAGADNITFASETDFVFNCFNPVNTFELLLRQGERVGELSYTSEAALEHPTVISVSKSKNELSEETIYTIKLKQNDKREVYQERGGILTLDIGKPYHDTEDRTLGHYSYLPAVNNISQRLIGFWVSHQWKWKGSMVCTADFNALDKMIEDHKWRKI